MIRALRVLRGFIIFLAIGHILLKISPKDFLRSNPKTSV